MTSFGTSSIKFYKFYAFMCMSGSSALWSSPCARWLCLRKLQVQRLQPCSFTMTTRRMQAWRLWGSRRCTAGRPSKASANGRSKLEERERRVQEQIDRQTDQNRQTSTLKHRWWSAWWEVMGGRRKYNLFSDFWGLGKVCFTFNLFCTHVALSVRWVWKKPCR